MVLVIKYAEINHVWKDGPEDLVVEHVCDLIFLCYIEANWNCYSIEFYLWRSALLVLDQV